MNALGLEIGAWRETQYRLHIETVLHERYDPDTKYSGMTLGAFRRGKSMPWIPGAEIDVWTKCLTHYRLNERCEPDESRDSAGKYVYKLESHAYFIQTIGGRDGGHVLCPSCRATHAERLARGRTTPIAAPRPPPAQGSLF